MYQTWTLSTNQKFGHIGNDISEKKEQSGMIDEETVHFGRSVESVQNYIQRQQVSWLTLMVVIIVNINIINPVRVLGSAHIMRISLALASL